VGLFYNAPEPTHGTSEHRSQIRHCIPQYVDKFQSLTAKDQYGSWTWHRWLQWYKLWPWTDLELTTLFLIVVVFVVITVWQRIELDTKRLHLIQNLTYTRHSH